jgi:pleuromutilin/lincosamide/streptogramin A transport system ATP-binding/permease protein
MTVLEIDQLKMSVNGKELLSIPHLQAQDGQRIGLVGKNGEGKTTLLRCIYGDISIEKGSVKVKGTCQLIPQLKRTDTVKSGGEVTAEYVTAALSDSPKLLLADEPTTNLDTSHVEWAEKELKRFNGTLILVSHDRQLLDNVCNMIWELEDGNVNVYAGNYSQYMKQKEMERQHQQTEYEKYKQKERQLTEALEQKKQKAEKATREPKNLSPSEKRILGAKPYFAKKQKKLNKGAQAIQTRLEKLQEVEKPKELTPIKMDLPNAKNVKNKIILRVEGLEGVIGKNKLWQPAAFFVSEGDKIAIIGPNGSGKTTLLKKLIEQSDKTISKSPAMRIGYFAQNLSVLDKDKTILENVSQDSLQSETLIRTVLARLHFYKDDVHKPVHVLSGGERVKVSLAKLFVSDSNTLILDEPTNYLDVYALEALEDLLKEYEGTILFASHDRRFISSIATKILSLEDQQLRMFDGNYEAYLEKEDKPKRDELEDQLLKVETAIANVLGRLSLEPNNERLEAEFQELVRKKKILEDR